MERTTLSLNVTESSPRVLNNDGVLYSDYLIQGDISSETSVESDSSADWDFSFRVLESSNAGGRLGEKI